MARYDRVTSPFVERFAADLTEVGMQRMSARVFACLLASEEGALTSAELGERLRASPAAISGAVRYLAQRHMVSRERTPGSRRERYRLYADTWFASLMDATNALTRFSTTLRGGVDTLGADTTAGRRLRENSEFLEFLRAELQDAMRRWQDERR
ncbi:MarR family transcriptional regulator [Streptomyces sp. AJS327]|nr:MarR family transcriptional regulator [Streptomyces sp. AJS327]MBA0053002.1 MarR family transcriptional regulator [Streptomyces sp. AJS327]